MFEALLSIAAGYALCLVSTLTSSVDLKRSNAELRAANRDLLNRIQAGSLDAYRILAEDEKPKEAKEPGPQNAHWTDDYST